MVGLLREGGGTFSKEVVLRDQKGGSEGTEFTGYRTVYQVEGVAPAQNLGQEGALCRDAGSRTLAGEQSVINCIGRGCTWLYHPEPCGPGQGSFCWAVPRAKARSEVGLGARDGEGQGHGEPTDRKEFSGWRTVMDGQGG